MATPVKLEIFMEDLTKAGLQSVGKNVGDVESRTLQLISALRQVIAEQKHQLEVNKAAGLSYTREAANIQALTGQVRGLEAGLKNLKKTQQETTESSPKIDIDTDAVTRKTNNLRMQFSQVARELPSLAMGPQMFILAVSNNLPMLADAIADVRKQNAQLTASGEKAVPVWKQLGGALFSWQTGLIAAISLGVVFGKDISNWVKKLIRGKEEVESASDRMDNLHKKMEAGSVAYGEQTVRLRTLSDAWTKLSSVSEKNKWIKDNRAEFDRLGISVTNVTDADNAFVNNTSAVIEALRLRASAAAAQSLAEEKYREALLKRNEAEQWQEKADNARKNGEINATGYIQDTRYGMQLGASELVEERAKGFEHEADAAIKAAEAIEKNADAYYSLAVAKESEAQAELKKAGLNTGLNNGGRPATLTDYASVLEDARVRARQTTEKLLLLIMQEGKAKRMALAKQEYDESLADITKNERDTLSRMDKARKQGHNIPQSQYDAVKDTARTNRLLAEQVYNEQVYQIEKEYRDKSAQALIDYYREYGTYQEKRLATAEDYALKIARAETGGERMSLADERDRKIQSLDFDELKKGMDWEKVFGDLGKVSTSTLENLREKLKEYLSGIGEDISPESYKEVMDAFDKFDAELADRSPLEALKSGYAGYVSAMEDVRRAQELLSQTQKFGSVIVEEYDEVTGKLTRKLITLADAEKLLQSATDKRAESLKKTTGAVNSIGRKGEAVVNAGNDIVDMLTSLGVEVPQAMQEILGGVGTMMSSLAEVDLTKPFSILTGATGALKGLGQTIGGLFGLGGADYTAYNSLKSEYEGLIDIWDSLISKKQQYINIDYGIEAQKAADEAARLVETQISRQRQLAKALMGAGKSIGSHSLGYRVNDRMGKSDWSRLSSLVGQQVNNIDDIFKLDADVIGKTLADEKFVSVLTTVNSEFIEYIQNIEKYGEQLEEIAEQEKAALTGIGFDEFRSGFADMLADLDAENKDFADNFEKYLQKAVFSSLVADQYKDRIRKLYDSWSVEAGDDGRLTADEAEKLRGDYQSIINDMLADRDKIMNDFGWTAGIDGANQSPGSGALTTMSQDSISRFEGIGRSMQTHLISMDKTVAEIKENQRRDSENLSVIASHTAHLVEMHELMIDMKTNGIKLQ